MNYNGAALPIIPPLALKSTLTSAAGPLTNRSPPPSPRRARRRGEDELEHDPTPRPPGEGLRHHPPRRSQRGALTQVFTNLLVNAAQAIGDGHAERNEIHLTTRTDAAGRAVVEVRDTGPGIPAHILPRIFDPFFTTKAVGVGMGLGLSICHGIIASSGGEITVESEFGQGTTFRITLPPAEQPPRSRTGRILLSKPFTLEAARAVIAQYLK